MKILITPVVGSILLYIIDEKYRPSPQAIKLTNSFFRLCIMYLLEKQDQKSSDAIDD